MPYEAQLSYQVCPIILTGGSAEQIPGGMLPMLSLFVSGETDALGMPDILTLDDSFGAFNVLPGGTLVSQQIAKYPFANQWVAANAVVKDVLTVSVIMDAPMRGPNAWQVKQTVFTGLKATLDRHNNKGGTYTVATPAYMYENMVMISMTDNSRGNNSLPQNAWRFDFEKPLVTISDLQGAQNLWMQKATNGVPVGANLSGQQPGQTQGFAPQARTIKAVGGLTVNQAPILNATYTSRLANYPVMPNPSAFPFAGIS
jgi:hypothetical protein